MNITKQTIEYVAGLAKLSLTDDEKDRMTEEMGRIVGYMDKLNELDTSDIKPREHVIPMSNVFREDKAGEPYDRDKILQNAPSEEDGCFRVPRVVE